MVQPKFKTLAMTTYNINMLHCQNPFNSEFFQDHQASVWNESDKSHGSQARVSGRANVISNFSTQNSEEPHPIIPDLDEAVR